MFEAFWLGLHNVFQWPAIGFMILGVVIGIWLGAIPGLGGVMGLVLLLPFTYSMNAVSAFALLLGMFAVTTTSDSIASVLLGIPGTAASQATILDGYPLAQQGHAARALGAAYTVSAFGGVFGALVLAVSLPLILPVIVMFGSPELFMLGVLGLAMVGSLSGSSILKGLTVAAFGLLLSCIGYGELEAIPRYYFGFDYLLQNLPLIPVVLGLFAIPELMELAIRNVSISRVPKETAMGGGILDGVRDAFRHWWLTLRCAVIGTYVGMLPGLGAAVVDWIAYGHAVQSAKDKSRFGQGDIRGVIAPEAANSATKGGALVPTIAFGIPGSLGAAILLGALLIQGLRPGPDMLTTQLTLTFSMVWTIVVANIVVALLLMVWTTQVAKVAFLPGHLIVPGVILFVFMGAWVEGATMGAWVSCFIMGIIGFIMKRGGWPRPPLILALILGPILERTFHISIRAHGGFNWLTRPMVLIILVLIALTILFAATGHIRNSRSDNVPQSGEGSERNPVISAPFSLLLLATFVWAGLEALKWPMEVAQFPLLASSAGAAFTLCTLVVDVRDLRVAVAGSGGTMAAIRASAERALLLNAGTFFLYLLAMIFITLVIGQKLALPVFIFVYLRRWGGYSRWISLAYALCGWAIMVGFYDKILHLFWYPSLLQQWIPADQSYWVPLWLFV